MKIVHTGGTKFCYGVRPVWHSLQKKKAISKNKKNKIIQDLCKWNNVFCSEAYIVYLLHYFSTYRK